MSQRVLAGLAGVFATVAVCGCGGHWSDTDAKNATDSVHDELMVETLCADGQQCKASQVRALERGALCGNASMLARHGAAVPNLGAIQCPTK